MLLSEAIEALLLATRVDGRSDSTVVNYREKLAYLLAFLGDVEVEKIHTDDLRRYAASLMGERTLYADHPVLPKRKGTLSPHTIQSYLRHAKRLFSWLHEEGRLDSNPAERIKVPKPRSRQVKAITPEDFLAILSTTDGGGVIDRRDRAMILLLADSGCRAGGLCGLRVQDVDLDYGTATAVEKGGRSRLIMFTETTAQAIREWLAVRPRDKGDWFFTGLGHTANDRMSPGALALMLRRRAKRVGVTGPCSPHAFRHGFAVSYLMAGGDLASLADILGHSSIVVTRDFYSVFTSEQLRQKHAKHSPVAQILGRKSDETGGID